jgi:hypothetical protein
VSAATSKGRARLVHFAAAACGLLTFLLTMIVLLAFPAVRSHSFALILVPCSLLALLFGFFWPRHSWRWGLWLSGGFWAYFALVCVSYLVNGTWPLMPALMLVGVLIAACLAALLGSKVSGRGAAARAPIGDS